MVCLFFSALALQLISSTFNLLDISNFFRDCAWGLLLLLFLASARVDLRRLYRFTSRPGASSGQSPPGPTRQPT